MEVESRRWSKRKRYLIYARLRSERCQDVRCVSFHDAKGYAEIPRPLYNAEPRVHQRDYIDIVAIESPLSPSLLFVLRSFFIRRSLGLPYVASLVARGLRDMHGIRDNTLPRVCTRKLLRTGIIEFQERFCYYFSKHSQLDQVSNGRSERQSKPTLAFSRTI